MYKAVVSLDMLSYQCILCLLGERSKVLRLGSTGYMKLLAELLGRADSCGGLGVELKTAFSLSLITPAGVAIAWTLSSPTVSLFDCFTF